jgi:exosortase/archaeosortase family protein
MDAAPEKAAPEKAAPGKSRGRASVLRFGVGFLILCGLLMVAFYGWFSHTAAFTRYLELNAHLAGAALEMTGTEVTVDGILVHGPGFSVEVRRGCDALQPLLLLASGILAFPVSFSRRVAGILVGAVVLQVLNVVRVASLLLVGVHAPDAFQEAHVEVWQVGFLVATLVLWLVWLQWATRPARG